MIGFGAPWWLLATAAVPLVYWLHRYRTPAVRREVSALFLWREASEGAGGSEHRHPPDPAWRRRALVALLLALALAQPWWRGAHLPVTVWIDDSLSMRTVEGNRSRLATGLSMLERAIADAGVEQAVLRSLGDSVLVRRSGEAGALDAATWTRGEPRVLRPPIPALMSGNSAHWLLTDGTGAALRRWAGIAPLARVVHVGEASGNVAVTRLAARRSAGDPRAFDLLVEVSNRGRAPVRRELALQAGDSVVDRLELELAAGETRHVTRRHRLPAAELSALLSPGDPLANDDALHLQAATFAPLRVLSDPACPPALRQAIAAHPALAVTEDGAAALQLACTPGERRAVPLVRIHTGAARPITFPPVWLPAVPVVGGSGSGAAFVRVSLPAAWIAAVEQELPRTGFEPLLVAGERPLVARRRGQAAEIHVLVDMARPAFVEQPEYAVFVSALAEAAVGRPLLDGVTMVARSPLESDIEPGLPFATAALRPPRVAIRRGMADALIAVAFALLLLDLALLFRNREAQVA